MENDNPFIEKGPDGGSGYLGGHSVNSTFASSDPLRVSANVMRHQYRPLSSTDQVLMTQVKDKCLELYQLIEGMGGSREASLAKTKVEEACMWAVKAITR